MIGAMFCMIFFLKKNYWIFIGYLIGYALIELFFNRSKPKLDYTKIVGLLMGGVILSILIITPHVFVNGLDREEKISECREKLALYAYKPSTPLNEKWLNAYLKQKGLPLKFVLEYNKWGSKIFRSSFGVYGYTTHSGSTRYYQLVGALICGFFGSIIFFTIFYADNQSRLLLAWTIFCALLLMGISLYRAWVIDFQAQGRYLMPIFPMVGMLMFKSQKAVNTRLTQLLITLLFLTSCYSFIFVGLGQIPKI